MQERDREGWRTGGIKAPPFPNLESWRRGRHEVVGGARVSGAGGGTVEVPETDKPCQQPEVILRWNHEVGGEGKKGAYCGGKHLRGLGNLWKKVRGRPNPVEMGGKKVLKSSKWNSGSGRKQKGKSGKRKTKKLKKRFPHRNSFCLGRPLKKNVQGNKRNSSGCWGGAVAKLVVLSGPGSRVLLCGLESQDLGGGLSSSQEEKKRGGWEADAFSKTGQRGAWPR